MGFRSWSSGVGLAAVLSLLACGRGSNGFGDASNPGPDATTTADVVDSSTVVMGHCASQADCDDHQACTEDTCIVGGVCQHDLHNELCPSGQRCDATRGCVSTSTCMHNSDCDDHVACTQDLCVAGGVCNNVRDDSQCADSEICSATLNCVARGHCGGDVDCDDGRFCNGVEHCATGLCAAGTAPNCVDGDPCTADLCSEAMHACQHPAVTPCGGTVTPGSYTLTPGAGMQLPQYSCASGRFGPVGVVTIASSAAGFSLMGFPVTLTGPVTSSGMFSAEGHVMMGPCDWQFLVTGSFTMPDHFMGSWTLSFGGLCDVSLGCNATTGEFSGALR